MTDSEDRAAFSVLGMHRSGTSLVMRCLNLLGAELGREERVMRPREGNNPAGFWEHVGIVAINNRILERFGGSWHEPPVLADGWEGSASLSDLRSRARDLVRKEFGDRPVWGFKDPRCSLTLPFWRELIPRLRAVVCVRNPLDVARSLRVRDGFPEEKSVRLWIEYTLAAFRNTSGIPREVTFYEDYFGDWDWALNRLAGIVGRDPPDSSSEVRRQLEAFRDEGLRHHRTSFADALASPLLDLPAKTLYLTLWLLYSRESPGKGTLAGDAEGGREALFRSLEAQLHAPEYRELRDALESRAVVLDQREQWIRHLEGRLQTVEVAASTREREIRELLGSRSWRLTAPLRRLWRFIDPA